MQYLGKLIARDAEDTDASNGLCTGEKEHGDDRYTISGKLKVLAVARSELHTIGMKKDCLKKVTVGFRSCLRADKVQSFPQTTKVDHLGHTSTL